MKLYTEEQVRESFKSGFRLAMETDGGLKEGQEEYINSLTPIKLPTDEEIEKQYFPFTNKLIKQGCIEGAKWMKYIIIYKVDER